MEGTLTNVSLVTKPPRAKCYLCGETDIGAVCHHCGRPLCRRHAPERRDWSDARQSAEHVGLGLESTPCGDTAVHCEDCHHVVRLPRRTLLLIGGVGVVAGRFLQQELPAGGLTLLLGAAAVLALGTTLYLWRWWQVRHGSPPIPWVPKLRSVEVVETINGALTLEPGGGYRSELSGAVGRLTVEAVLGEPERSIYQRYIGKHQVSEAEDVPFQAGFLLLGGSAAITFDASAGSADGSPRVLALEGRTSEEPAGRAVRGEGIGEWHREWFYRIDAVSDEEPRLPVQLIPFVVAEAGGQILGLELRWGEALPPPPVVESSKRSRRSGRVRPVLGLAAVEELEIRVPFSWGKIEGSSDHYLARTEPDGSGGLSHVITWRKVVPALKEAMRCRRDFKLRFERRVDLSVRIEGHLALELQGAFSGLDRVDSFFCLGHRWEAPAELTTRVNATLDLHLGGLHHRDLRVFPDAKRPQERPLVEPLTFEGVVPDHTAVIALGRALAEQDFYLKSVVENPPRSGTRPNSLTRLWDLSGRVDDRVFPMEFHLTVTGEEVPASGRTGPIGTTTTTLAVQGGYGDPIFEEKVVSTGETLRSLVERTLGALKRSEPASEEPETPSWTRAKPAASSPASTSGPVAGPSYHRAGRLRDLLLDGRISQEVYLELKGELAREGGSSDSLARGEEEGP
jgi:hypothetical protein